MHAVDERRTVGGRFAFAYCDTGERHGLLLSVTWKKWKRHVRLGAQNYNEQSLFNISFIYI
ncbi:hypothetical protein F7R13_31345 [Burkholderia territorii]|uniref:Uncharacterized protein n=1 Tax=Burkholderia territorii TaxID=1503055 RepID=A0A6L3N7H9_9BURK|nr:hypothetical protein F7R13_31345 [Burkholderia territorii]